MVKRAAQGSVRKLPPNKLGEVHYEARLPRFVDPRRPALKRRFRSVSDAQVAINAEIAAFNEGRYRATRTDRRIRRVNAAVSDYIQARSADIADPISARTRSGYRAALKNQIMRPGANIGSIEISLMDSEKVDEWLRRLAQAGVPQSRRQYATRLLLAALRTEPATANILFTPGAASRTPRTKAGRAARNKVDPVFLPTWAEFASLIQAIERWPDRLLIALMGFTGLRWSEAISLQVEDLATQANTIDVVRVWVKQDAHDGGGWVCEAVKAGNPAPVVIPKPLHRALRRLAATRKPTGAETGNLLFRADQRRRGGMQLMHAGNFRRRVWLQARESAGVGPDDTLPPLDPRRKGLKVKDLRAFAASVMVDSGANQFEVMGLLRHADTRTSERYYVRAQDRASDASRRMLRVQTGLSLADRLEAVWGAWARQYAGAAKSLTSPVQRG